MQIFSSLLQHLFPYKAEHIRSSKGFTLIELLISAAIITIISGIVLTKFNSFDGTVLLKSLAYEVGSGIREAQIYSVSVVSASASNPSFRYPYGVSFTPGAQSYVFFQFNDADITKVPDYVTGPVTVLNTPTFTGSIEVFDVCITRVGVESCFSSNPSISRIDISFRRPEFSAIFFTPGVTTAQLSTIESVKIKLRSTRNPSNVWVVNVSLLGQISVFKQ
jgi:prepilin-type N-terminal cleavage/methylation domain-containing protein